MAALARGKNPALLFAVGLLLLSTSLASAGGTADPRDAGPLHPSGVVGGRDSPPAPTAGPASSISSSTGTARTSTTLPRHSPAPFHAAPTWPGWNPTSGRPSPNIGRNTAQTVPLTTANCPTSYSEPPWEWLTYDPQDSSFWAAAPPGCVDEITTTSDGGWSVAAAYPTGVDPFGVAVQPVTHLVFVTNNGSGNVTVINGTTGVTVANISVGTSPYGVAYDPGTQDVVVANGGSDTLSIISTTTLSVVGTVGVGSDPIGVAVDPRTAQVFVANHGSDNVSVVATSTDTVVANLAAGSDPYGVALDNVTDQVYVTNAGSANLSVIDAANDSFVVSIDTGNGIDPEGLAYDSIHQVFWVAANFYTVLVNTSSQSVMGYVATDPSGAAFDPATGVACLTNTANATLRCVTFPGFLFPIDWIEFQETGLGNVPNWSVTLYWPGNYRTSAVNWSGQLDQVWFEVFGVSSDTYSYAIRPTDGFYPTVPTGSVDPTPATPAVVNVAFVPVSSTFPVNFSETGLPAATPWNVTLAGVANQSSTNASGFREPNGAYAFAVSAGPGFIASPSQGSLLVDGANVSVTVSFAPAPPPPPTLTVTFAETGLGTGVLWRASVNGASEVTSDSALRFELLSGYYSYLVPAVAGYAPPVPASGSFELVGGNLTIPIDFAPLYSLRFYEGGLPPYSNWSVAVDGRSASLFGPGITFTLAGGSHTFAIASISGYTVTPESGTLDLEGDLTVSVTFNASAPAGHPPTLYTVTVAEVGLPAGTPWCVVLNGTALCSSSAVTQTRLPNGTGYAYSVPPVPGYLVGPVSGELMVDGAPVGVTVTFASVPAVPNPAPAVVAPPPALVLATGVVAAAGLGVLLGYVVFRRPPGT